MTALIYYDDAAVLPAAEICAPRCLPEYESALLAFDGRLQLGEGPIGARHDRACCAWTSCAAWFTVDPRRPVIA